jgi:hypothetical protein
MNEGRMLRCDACGASLAKRPVGERQPTRCALCRGQPQVKQVQKLPPKQQPMRGQSYDEEWLAAQLKPPRMPWET